MTSSLDLFSSFEPRKTPNILMGKNTYMIVFQKGSIDMGKRSFNDVLCVPSLTTSILSFYLINHGAQDKMVEITPGHLYNKDMETRDIIATDVVDHASQLYSFSHFSLNDDIPLVDVHTLPPRVNHICEE